MKKIPFFSVLAFLLFTGPAGSELVDSISMYGITWQFDKKVEAGKFLTGDPYVLGPVVIKSVTPAPEGTGKGFRNGSMLNPPVTSFSGYDGRFHNNFREELSAKYPLNMKPGDSLISTISLKELQQNQIIPDVGKEIRKIPRSRPRLSLPAWLQCLRKALSGPPTVMRRKESSGPQARSNGNSCRNIRLSEKPQSLNSLSELLNGRGSTMSTAGRAGNSILRKICRVTAGNSRGSSPWRGL